MEADEIIFNIEGSDKECAFFVLYAGLRIYYDNKNLIHADSGQMSIAAAECYCLLNQLKENFPKEFEEAKAEFKEVYGNNFW